mmetsp:Transcript_15082/g.17179  ORF Transcript_15082/g.17179 Transcript_15082/m.17179 type:complete len:340 (-) Transcript_15082:130-1149(-)
MLSAPYIALFLNCGVVLGSSAFSWSSICTRATTTSRNKALFQNDDCCCDGGGECTHSRSLTPTGEISRRILVKETLTISSVTTTTAYMMPLLTLLSSTDIAIAAGCDPKEPSCGSDGKVTDGESSSTIQSIPRVTNKITHVVQLVINIGERREEVGFLRFGLYGDDCPVNVRRMIQFLTTIGITGDNSNNKDDMENLIDIKTQQVTILVGGKCSTICPGKGIEFGVPSQEKAYAKNIGLPKAGKNFLPQSRPASSQEEVSARKHTVAGLISVPEKGIGYGGSNNNIDEAYANAFLVTTADSDLSEFFDTNLHRRVIGQIIDDESMEFLARLASLPIQKK